MHHSSDGHVAWGRSPGQAWWVLATPDPRKDLFDLLEKGVADGVFPGCVALVWRDDAVVYHEAHGRLATDARLPVSERLVERDTRFDLASLTKVLATTSMTAVSLARGKVALDAPVPEPWSAACPGATLEDLLTHSAGCAAHREFFVDVGPGDRDGLLAAVSETPPAYPRGSRAVYSDLGFLILGAWLEKVWDQRLDHLFERLLAPSLYDDGAPVARLGFRPTDGPHLAHRHEHWIAPTEVYDPALHEVPPAWLSLRRGPDLAAHGVVHDDNAWAMKGVAGHAGLFGTAEAVLDVALAWQRDQLLGVGPRWRDRFWSPSPVPGSTRRLGFDGVDPDGSGSTGTALSQSAVGHLGYTGCSLWIDHEKRSIYVLLSNRVHPVRPEPAAIRGLRRGFHQAAARL